MTPKSISICLLATLLFVLPNSLSAQEVAQEAPAQQEEMTLVQKASRVMAFRIFSQMKKQGAEFDTEQLVEGLTLAINDKELGMSDEEVNAVLTSFNEEMLKRLMERRRIAGEENLAAAEKFFAENKTAEGVQVLESGIQYKVLKPSEGKSPAITDRVNVKYRGRLLDGTVFDGTEGDETAAFPVGGVIRGMTEILLKMKVGEKVEVYIPGELAYGEMGPRDQTGRPRMDSKIGPNAALIFELELISIDE
jgi:FKBP-type peptidyl-prolyl cis-trans isomerase